MKPTANPGRTKGFGHALRHVAKRGRTSSFRARRVDPPGGGAYVLGMAIRPIIILPDPVLRAMSAPLDRVDAELLQLADDMIETMYAAPGIGLAAIQIAVPKRLVVIDVSRDDEVRDPKIFINPEVVWRSDEMSVYEEGCLSIPEYYAEVERPARVKVAYVDRAGEKKEIEADGLLATCLQHEIDHLNGTLFIDHLSKLKRDMVVRKFTKAAKLGTPAEKKPRPSPSGNTDAT